MIETPASPLPVFLRPIGPLLAAVYKRGVQARNRRFDTDPGASARLSIPVISVGNLSTGGTGKTPMVQWIARKLRDDGYSPIIAMRGYKARAGERSDEQIEHEERLADTPVIANPKRAEAVRDFLLRKPGQYDCCILDDGFQHRQLARDLDLVLIDATRSPFDDRLLPMGHLREPVENLARADAVILTCADLKDESRIDLLRLQVAREHGRAPIAHFKHVWPSIRIFESGRDSEAPVGELARRRVLVLCAIGHPHRFLDQLEMHGVQVIGHHAFRDHARYDEDRVRRVIRQAGAHKVEAIVTTEKDWTKLRELNGVQQSPVPFVRPLLDVEPIDGADELVTMLQKVLRGEMPAPIEPLPFEGAAPVGQPRISG